jgi:ABC-type bacteriocin/lantibiotic exporter with double-glycine peptidase domain
VHTNYLLKLKDIKEGLALTLRFNKFIIRYWKIQVLIFMLGNSSMVLGLVNPYIGKFILDKGILGRSPEALLGYSIVAAGIFVVGLILSLTYDYLKNYTVVKVEADLSREVFRKIKRQSLGQLQTLPSAISLFRITNDISNASTIINVILVHFISVVLKIIFITIIILFLNPLLLGIILAYQVLVLLRVGIVSRITEILNRLSLRQSEIIYKKLNNFFSRMYLHKVFGTVARESREYMHHFFDALRLNMRGARLRVQIGLATSLVDKVFFGLISFIGALLVIKGRITFGTLSAILMYISQGIVAYSALTGLAGQLVVNRVPLERLSTLLDQPEEPGVSRVGTHKPADIREIKADDLSFGYKPGISVVSGIHFVIPAGAHVGLVGYSGCGKTTLISLLLDLYEPQKGKISLGGIALDTIDHGYQLQNIGVCLQEPFLFDTSIAENILYANKRAARGDIIETLRLAEATGFINELPETIDAQIGEEGYRLSQGQKQRIAIARALVKKPQVLILDEAMSSLDSPTEEKIIANIRSNFPQSTLIIVSHRISAVRGMDAIYFMAGPNRMYMGTHDQLLKDNPLYRDFFSTQLGSA